MGLSKFLQANFYVPILHWLDWYEDIKRGVITQKNFELFELGLSDHIGNKYQPLGYRRLKEVIKLARILNPRSTFVDVGCGLGRPILVALEMGFQHAIGIDISSELIRGCKKNTHNKSNSVELFCCDSNDYNFPPGTLTIFLFNPFDKQRIAKLIDKLGSIRYRGLIIYFNPRHEVIFKKKRLITELRWQNFGLFEERCHFYEI